MIIDQATSEPTVVAHTPRWRIAAVAVVVMLAIGIGVVLGVALGARRGAGIGAAADAVPATAVVYVEARLDLPGAQRANLRGLIERFPGADADALLGAALADTLDEAVNVTPFMYSTDVAPWFDGRASMALLTLPVGSGAAPPDAVFLFGIRDAAAASAVAERLVDEIGAQGATLRSSQSHGVTIHSLASTSGAPMVGDVSFALTDDQLVVGSTEGAVTAVLDVRAGDTPSLGGRDDVRSLSATLPTEFSGIAFVDTSSILSAVLATQPGATAPGFDELMADAPTLMLATLTFGSDAVVVDSSSHLPDGTAATNQSRDVADQVPADALVYSEAGALGDTFVRSIRAMRASLGVLPPDEAAGLDDVEAALGGNLEGLASWIGDGAISIGNDGEEWYAGAVLEATDADAAAATMNQLRSLVSLATLEPESGVSISTETVAGAEVTTIRVAMSGDEVFAQEMDGLAVQWAVDGDRVIIGIGDRFVSRVLELDPANSLGSSARFKAAKARTGGDGSGLMFIDLAGVRDAVAELLPGEERVAYERDVAPWLAPLDYLVSGSRVAGDEATEHMELVLR